MRSDSFFMNIHKCVQHSSNQTRHEQISNKITQKVETWSFNSSLKIHGRRSRATIYNEKTQQSQMLKARESPLVTIESSNHEQRFKTVKRDYSTLYVKSPQATLKNGNVIWANIKQTHKPTSKLPDVMCLTKFANKPRATSELSSKVHGWHRLS